MFQESDPRSGLGGWGDPSTDYSVTDGAFTDFQLAYPSPHILRRNFTLQPFLDFASLEIFPEPAQMANESITITKISNLIANYTGDFKGFQKEFEATEVRCGVRQCSSRARACFFLGSSLISSPWYWRVSMAPPSHNEYHILILLQ